MSVLAFLRASLEVKRMHQGEQLLWGSSKGTLKSCLCVCKEFFSVVLPYSWICLKTFSVPVNHSAIFCPHSASVKVHKMHNWAANDIFQELMLLNTALNTVCFVYSNCSWPSVRICQRDLFCRSWSANFHQGQVNLGPMFLCPEVLGLWERSWMTASFSKRESDT